MNNSAITTSELRSMYFYIIIQLISKNYLVRTVIELIKNESYYQSMYSQFIGPVDIAIKTVCKNFAFSELYEIAALCNVLHCNIRSVYPKIDFRDYMAICDNIFTPGAPVIANCEIAILWSHASNEKDARETNNGIWSPNHFVPLISSAIYDESDYSNQSIPLAAVIYLSIN
jgi:hypothetical protein